MDHACDSIVLIPDPLPLFLMNDAFNKFTRLLFTPLTNRYPTDFIHTTTFNDTRIFYFHPHSHNSSSKWPISIVIAILLFRWIFTRLDFFLMNDAFNNFARFFHTIHQQISHIFWPRFYSHHHIQWRTHFLFFRMYFSNQWHTHFEFFNAFFFWWHKHLFIGLAKCRLASIISSNLDLAEFYFDTVLNQLIMRLQYVFECFHMQSIPTWKLWIDRTTNNTN